MRFEAKVRPDWADGNGHMTDFRHGRVFGDAMDALYRQVGIDEAYRRGGQMSYTVESHVRHVAEGKVEEQMHSQVDAAAAQAYPMSPAGAGLPVGSRI